MRNSRRTFSVSPTAKKVAVVVLIVMLAFALYFCCNWPEGRPVRTNAPFDRYQVVAHYGGGVHNHWTITLEKDGTYVIDKLGPALSDEFKGAGRLDDDSTVALFQLIEKVDYFSLPDDLGTRVFGAAVGRIIVKNDDRSHEVFLGMYSEPSNAKERRAFRVFNELNRIVLAQELQRVRQVPVD